MTRHTPLLAFLLISNAHAASFTKIADISGSDGLATGFVDAGGNIYSVSMYADTIYQTTPFGLTSVIHTFSGPDGDAPNTPLVTDSGGNFYGTTRSGGAYGSSGDTGTLFELSPAGALSTLHSFGGAHDGCTPLTGPTISGATVVGNAYYCGPSLSGNLWKYGAKSRKYANLYSFTAQQGPGTNDDGHCPFGGAVLLNGIYYGVTTGAGVANEGYPNGTIYSYNPSNRTLTTLYAFGDTARDGEWPDQNVVIRKGVIYGTTATLNGAPFPGIIWSFRISNGVFTTMHVFPAGSGAGPNSPLLLNTDGILYGTTAPNEGSDLGELFSITATKQFTDLVAFNATDGYELYTGSVVNDASGNLYLGLSGGSNSAAVWIYSP